MTTRPRDAIDRARVTPQAVLEEASAYRDSAQRLRNAGEIAMLHTVRLLCHVSPLTRWIRGAAAE